MDINNAFDEILKIQDKLDKTNAVNPKITVDGKEYTLYHEGNKPSANDIEALPTSGGTMSGSIDLENNIPVNGIAKDGTVIPLILLYGKDVFMGGGNNTNLYLRSVNNPIVQVGGNDYKLYHTGNKPTPSDIGANSGLFSGSVPSMTSGWIDNVDTVVFNYNNCFHIQAMSYFQAPAGGFYRISGQVHIVGEAALYYYKNSSSSPTGTVFHTSSDTASREEAFISPVIPLLKGDTLQFYSNTNSAFSIKSLTIEKLNGGI